MDFQFFSGHSVLIVRGNVVSIQVKCNYSAADRWKPDCFTR